MKIHIDKKNDRLYFRLDEKPAVKGNEDMKIHVDKKNDCLYFRLDEKQIVESEEIKPGIILDYDKNDQVVGIEFLSISLRVSQEELSSIHFFTA